jgi:hypothetical protein
MAIEFVVEDGTGKSDATSYVSVAEMKQYWDNMGYDYSALSDDEIEQLLNKSTQVLDGMYRHLLPGIRSIGTQALQWPRDWATTYDRYDIGSGSIPDAIEDALCEMAYLKNSGETLQPAHEGGALTSKSVSVDGAVSKSESYSPGTAPLNGRKRFVAVEDCLRKILGPMYKASLTVVRT